MAIKIEHSLLTQIRERISSGLKRKAITKCSSWSEQYRIMGQPFPGKWTFKHHPWLRDMHDCTAELVIGQKSAQMGFTETALNKVFFNIDIKGVSCLYILPSEKPDASDFSTSRFDPALDASDHLRNLFSDVRNIGHKRAGTANLFVRGSRSRSQMKSIPVGSITYDELDEMQQENISLAHERVSGQLEHQEFMLSTPTIQGVGINKYFINSSQNHFFFKCPCCGQLTELIFPDCLRIFADHENDKRLNDTLLVCKECDGVLHHEDKINFLKEGIWVPSYTDRDSVGYYVNQLYSMTVKPKEIALSYIRAQFDPSDEQELYNSKLGIPHEVKGARVADADFNNCEKDYVKVDGGKGFITMGVDVGKFLHYEIDSWSVNNVASTDLSIMARPHMITEGTVVDFEELDILMKRYNISFCVIDANPERRKASEFARRFRGRVRMCFYGSAAKGKEITVHTEDEATITVDRTSWLDLSIGRFKNASITVPKDLSLEYKKHIKALVRIYEKDSLGNHVGRYVNSGDDHFGHARNYAEIALPLGAQLGQSQNVSGVM